MGGVASKDRIDFARVGVVADTIKWFAFGVALAVAGMAFSYLTNFAMAGAALAMTKSYEYPFVSKGPKYKFWRRLNVLFHIDAVLVAAGSLTLFVIGMFAASNAITNSLAK